MPASSDIRLVDGQFDFVKGVFGDRIRTIATQQSPNGVPRNGIVWLNNGTCRGGALTQRTGWHQIVKDAAWAGIFQGAFMLERDFGDPYIVLAIGGKLWRVRVDSNNEVDNLSAIFGGGLNMPPT